MNKAVRHIAPARPVGGGRKISIVLLCAGEANRMRSYGPRPLIKITPNQTLLGHQLSILEKFIPDHEIIMVCGYEADRVMDNTPHYIVKVENEQYSANNVSRSIGLGLRAATTNRILVLYGDLLFNAETIKGLSFDSSFRVLDGGGLFNEEEVGCTSNQQGVVEHMFYDIPNKWAQIMYLQGEELNLVRKTVWNRDKQNLFGFEVINSAIESGGEFTTQTPKKMKILDIDSTKNLLDIGLVI